MHDLLFIQVNSSAKKITEVLVYFKTHIFVYTSAKGGAGVYEKPQNGIHQRGIYTTERQENIL